MTFANTKSIAQLQEEMSRKGLGEVCSLKPQTSLFGDLSRTLDVEPSSFSETQALGTRGHGVSLSNERFLQVTCKCGLVCRAAQRAKKS